MPAIFMGQPHRNLVLAQNFRVEHREKTPESIEPLPEGFEKIILLLSGHPAFQDDPRVDVAHSGNPLVVPKPQAVDFRTLPESLYQRAGRERVRNSIAPGKRPIRVGLYDEGPQDVA